MTTQDSPHSSVVGQPPLEETAGSPQSRLAGQTFEVKDLHQELRTGFLVHQLSDREVHGSLMGDSSRCDVESRSVDRADCFCAGGMRTARDGGHFGCPSESRSVDGAGHESYRSARGRSALAPHYGAPGGPDPLACPGRGATRGADLTAALDRRPDHARPRAAPPPGQASGPGHPPAVMPSSRESISWASPRRDRSTESVFRLAEKRPLSGEADVRPLFLGMSDTPSGTMMSQASVQTNPQAQDGRIPLRCPRPEAGRLLNPHSHTHPRKFLHGRGRPYHSLWASRSVWRAVSSWDAYHSPWYKQWGQVIISVAVLLPGK